MIVSQLGEGKTPETLVEDFPYLSREDVADALRYAAWVLDTNEMGIVSA